LEHLNYRAHFKGVAVKFLVFSDDWGEHPSSCQHLFKILTGSSPTIWVNTVGLRLPEFNLNDAVKSFRKLSAMMSEPLRDRHPDEKNNPVVSNPPMTPFHHPQWLADWNNHSLLKHVRKELLQQGFDEFTIITTTPSICDVVSSLGANKVIYYCVDDFSEWPGMEKQLILSLEERLLKSVTAVICTSQNLYEKFKNNLPTHLLKHGVDLELFSSPALVEHHSMSYIPTPRVGYFGNIDQRSDFHFIQKLALAIPYVSFVFTGPVQANVSILKQHPNIFFTGALRYEELPSIVKGWDACLLPYHLNALTRNINPLKLKEYLATGKPVISTPLPDVCELSEFVRIIEARNIGGWRTAVDEAISGQWVPDVQAISNFLAHESWTRKADIFLRICQVV
jgi:glycosyltransferase involved in cell wall biosynthesis